MPNDSKFQNRPLPKSNKTRQALKKMEDAGAVVLGKDGYGGIRILEPYRGEEEKTRH